MSSNKLYTLSYFRKRLIDKGIHSKIIVDKYGDSDIRYWTILIEPRESKLLCTCKKRSASDFSFAFQIPNGNTVQLTTLSMEVIIDFINKNKVFGE